MGLCKACADLDGFYGSRRSHGMVIFGSITHQSANLKLWSFWDSNHWKMAKPTLDREKNIGTQTHNMHIHI
jgi:hypothetical protein